MLKKIERGMQKWGHYLLALLCAGVILLSALWTREQRATEEENQTALADQSQRLAEAEQTAKPTIWLKPVLGEMIQGYSEEPIYFPATGIWKTHPSLDFEAGVGERVSALAAGIVLHAGNMIRIDHGEGYVSVYQGIEPAVQAGQKIKAGETLGTAGNKVPYEGGGHICVLLLKDGIPIEFEVQ